MAAYSICESALILPQPLNHAQLRVRLLLLASRSIALRAGGGVLPNLLSKYRRTPVSQVTPLEVAQAGSCPDRPWSGDSPT
jgi:hypothetical protein